MPRSSLALALMLVATLALPAAAQTMTGTAASHWRDYDRKDGFRAFAWNGVEASGFSWDAVSADAARLLALRSCEAARRNRGPECRIVDERQD